MINVEQEKPLLNAIEAAKVFAEIYGSNRPPHFQVVNRAWSKGKLVNGTRIKLDFISTPAGRRTTRAAIIRFLEHGGEDGAAGSIRNPRDPSPSHLEAERELEAAGIA